MHKVLLAFFAVIMLASCAKPEGYPEMVYDYITTDMTAIVIHSNDSNAEVGFIADAEGNIFVDIFSLRIPGYIYSMLDNSTGVQMITNSRATMLYYNEKLYIRGKETDFFENNKAMVVDSRVMLELRCVEDTFGAKFEFEKKKGDFHASVSFHHEIYEYQKIDGGGASSLANAPNIERMEQISEDHCTAVYTGYVDGRFRIEAINGLLVSLVREGFEMVDRPSETMVLLCRGDSYVTIKSWGVQDVRANYINCIMRDE